MKLVNWALPHTLELSHSNSPNAPYTNIYIKPLPDSYGKNMWLKYLAIFHQSKKNGVFKPVKDSLDKDITGETFEELLELLIKSQSIKLNAIENRQCLSLPKENHIFREIGVKKEILNIEEELENFKIQKSIVILGMVC